MQLCQHQVELSIPLFVSCLCSAVVESRRIMRKMKSYITYRFASMVQHLSVLTLLIYVTNCSINAFYVVLLALFNDMSMFAVVYDRQPVRRAHETAEVTKLVYMAGMLGILEAGFSMLFAYGVGPSGFGTRDYNMHKGGPEGIGGCDTQLQAVIWLQMFISSEILIFSARCPSFMWASLRPSVGLVTSVMGANIIACIIASQATAWGNIPAQDIVLIWCYNLLVLVLIDVAKVAFLNYLNESTDVLPDYVYVKSHWHSDIHEETYPTDFETTDRMTRMSAASYRMNDWAIERNERLIAMIPTRESIVSESKQQHNSSF